MGTVGLILRLPCYPLRSPESGDPDPSHYAFSDAFLLDCVDEFSGPQQMWEVMGRGNQGAAEAVLTAAARLDERYLGQVYALFMLGRAQQAIAAQDERGLLALLAEDEGLAGARDLQGRSLWHHLAGAEGSAQLLEALLGAVADPGRWVDLTDRTGNTSLHLAVEHEQPAAMALLLRAGADPNLQNHDPSKYSSTGSWSIKARDVGFAIPVPQKHQTPLHIAADQGSAELVRLLLVHRGREPLQLGLRDSSGATPLHLALEAQVGQGWARRGTVHCMGEGWQVGRWRWKRSSGRACGPAAPGGRRSCPAEPGSKRVAQPAAPTGGDSVHGWEVERWEVVLGVACRHRGGRPQRRLARLMGWLAGVVAAAPPLTSVLVLTAVRRRRARRWSRPCWGREPTLRPAWATAARPCTSAAVQAWPAWRNCSCAQGKWTWRALGRRAGCPCSSPPAAARWRACGCCCSMAPTQRRCARERQPWKSPASTSVQHAWRRWSRQRQRHRREGDDARAAVLLLCVAKILAARLFHSTP